MVDLSDGAGVHSIAPGYQKTIKSYTSPRITVAVRAAASSQRKRAA